MGKALENWSLHQRIFFLLPLKYDIINNGACVPFVELTTFKSLITLIESHENSTSSFKLDQYNFCLLLIY